MTQTNLNLNYKTMTKTILNNYYNAYDNNFSSMNIFYNNNSVFTFMEEEFNSFHELTSRLVDFYKIHKFNHNILKHDAQPFDNNKLLLSVSGTISTNNQNQLQNFSETLVIEQMVNGDLKIINTIFRVCD
jgi:hypothetical protein